jgi:ribosome-binding factor A
VLGDDEQRESTAAALESAKGVIRSAVGKDLGVRVTPSIEFFLDGLPESALALDSLLAKVREQDAEVSKLRKEASYAGEPDAYKAPKIIDNSNKPAPADRITNWDDV